MTEPGRTVDIALLADRPGLVATLTAWFVDAWQPYYGPDGPGDAVADLHGCLNRHALPIAVVALDARGALLGTAALKQVSAGSELGVGPWMAAFLVGPAHRGKGIGSALVAAIEGEAARLGYDRVYASTDAADGILLRRGWRPYGVTKSLRGPLRIYRFLTGE